MSSVNEAPPDVPSSIWLESRPGSPAIGDLWLLSWDGQTLGLAVICGTAPDFVLVWPATLPREPIFPIAFRVESTPLGVPMMVWPTRETGVGLHLLHRRYGSILSERTMALTLEAVEEDRDAPLDVARPTVAPELVEAASDGMTDLWESICLNTWPQPQLGASPFSSAALERAGVGLTRLMSALDIQTPEAVAMYRGEVFPSAGQVQTIASLAGTGEDLLLAGDPNSLLLISPIWKQRVVDAADQLNIGEKALRDLVRADLALAARSDGVPESIIDASIDRVVQRGTR